MLLGYARVSAQEQNPGNQVCALKERGCERIFTDYCSGRRARQSQLDAALDFLRAGDALAVWRFDRAARSTPDLLSQAVDLQHKGCELVSLTEQIDTSTLGGKAVFTVMAALAQFAADLNGARTKLAYRAKKASGMPWGRRSAFHAPEKVCSDETRIEAAILNRDASARLALGTAWLGRGRGLLAVFSLASLVLLSGGESALAQGSAEGDRAALVALYNATDGANWSNNTNWLSTQPLQDWYGITTTPTDRVTQINLRDNELMGQIPSELAQLSRLQNLWLDRNQLTGPIPPELGQLSNLEGINLDDNGLTGPIPPELGGLSELVSLRLEQNQLTGPIPPELGDLSALRLLYLYENSLTGTIPEELGDLSALRFLSLYENSLTGTIPPELGDLSALESLRLYENSLTGTIPPELGQLSSLRFLWLWDNQLMGPIPQELGQLGNLESLILVRNQLTGPIPPELGQLSNLESLYLQGNQLTGPIPPELGQLSKLTTLHLYDNSLTGTIPEALGTLANLRTATFFGNQLTGTIPDGLGVSADRGALTLFYSRTGGPSSWTNTGGWTTSAPLSEWHGVTTDSAGRVTRLDLASNGLSGSVHESVSALEKLEQLILMGNIALGDPLPASLAQLSNLNLLDVSDTHVCAPADSTFQAWLAGIDYSGTACPPSPVRTPAVSLPCWQQPPRLALWTEQIDYRAGDTVRLFRTTHPVQDCGERRHTLLYYLEPAGGGPRLYLAPKSGSNDLHEQPVDHRGLPADSSSPSRLDRTDRQLAWEGLAPEPGLWQFVAELRGAGPTRRAFARFVVAERSQLLNRRGFDREVREDLTLRADTVYYLGHQLFVRDGATLTIEPGTLVKAWGRNAAIIVEQGGTIIAEGTLDAPVVLTCSLRVGFRKPGCWGGLRILGRAPVTRLEGRAPGILPPERSGYGGTDELDASGTLRYVRIEFAGAGAEPGDTAPALGVYGAGDSTVLDHLQVLASLTEGIAFSGGTARCDYCVASGSGEAGLAWERGWRGGASHLLVLHGRDGSDGLRGDNDPEGYDLEPRSLPTFSNVTLVHASPYGTRARAAAGLRLESGSGVIATDLLATRFGDGAIHARGRSGLLFTDGESRVDNAILYRNGYRSGTGQLRGSIAAGVQFVDRDPKLRRVRWEAGPDPRPRSGSPALREREGSETAGESYVGAFGSENWLEEWTFFGPESDYDTRDAEVQP